MKPALSRTLLWGLFALLLVASGSTVLSACDFAVRPLFGLNYCAAAKQGAGLETETARARELEARLRDAELALAEKPECPRREARRVEPPPQQQPQKPVEELKLPEKVADLKGCWESVNGEQPITTDTPEQRPIGKVRTCYCFGSDGAGRVKLLYTDGVKCRGPISARISGTTLRIEQPAFNCPSNGVNHGLVASRTVCHADENGSASCDTQWLGRMQNRVPDEKYRRVEKDRCG